MVAISLYKGNLHRAPDTPRQWLMPTRKISLNDFKTLLQRRSRALARLQSAHATTSNPNPNSGTEQPQSDGSLEVIVNDSSGFKVDGEKLVNQLANSNDDDDDDDENGRKQSTGDDDDCLVIPSGELLALEVANSKVVLPENGSNASVDGLQQEEKLLTKSEDQLVAAKDDTLSEKEKRKKEVEEKLQVLNERKHKLVQVLKQILHAEEELRRRNNVQGITITGRPIVSLQVDVTNTNTNDSGSTRENGGDVEGVDVDDVSTRSRNMTRMSPSSDSLHRRPPFSMVPNSSRGFVGSSPSRFAPTSPSPSPAGGTSVFRDPNPNPNPNLNPNPWN